MNEPYMATVGIPETKSYAAKGIAPSVRPFRSREPPPSVGGLPRLKRTPYSTSIVEWLLHPLGKG